MKTVKLLKGFFLLSLTTLSCSQENNTLFPSDGHVTLKAVLNENEITKVGDAWEGTEHVGVYMTGADDFTVVDDISNKEFLVSPGAGNILTAVDAPFAYPADGREVKFIAYYPYSKSVTNLLYKINLADTGVSDHDLLYAKTSDAYNQAMAEAVPLLFIHQLSKLILNVKIQSVNNSGETITQAATGWSAFITRHATADFDLATGDLLNIGTVTTLPMSPIQSVAESIILPGSEGKVIIRHEESEYEWNTENIAFKSGVQYTYTITLTDASERVSVKLESTIKGWDNEVHDIELEEKTDESDTPGASGEYAGNLDLSAFTRGASAYLSTVTISGTKYPAIKLGSTGNFGNCESQPIGAGSSSLAFYAVSWSDKTGALKISVKNGGKINGKSSITVKPLGNAGAAGASADYVMTVAPADYYQFGLTDVTAATTLTFETIDDGGDKRAIFFGVNVQ
ncbi:MAG: fimbrillin family protein [Bacteroidales bacterium]